MAAGRQYTKDQLNNLMAGHAAQTAQIVTNAAEFKAFLDSLTDADLTNYGFGAAEIATIREVYGHVGTLIGVAVGQVQVVVNGTPTAIDFRGQLRRLGGYTF